MAGVLGLRWSPSSIKTQARKKSAETQRNVLFEAQPILVHRLVLEDIGGAAGRLLHRRPTEGSRRHIVHRLPQRHQAVAGHVGVDAKVPADDARRRKCDWRRTRGRSTYLKVLVPWNKLVVLYRLGERRGWRTRHRAPQANSLNSQTSAAGGDANTEKNQRNGKNRCWRADVASNTITEDS